MTKFHIVAHLECMQDFYHFKFGAMYRRQNNLNSIDILLYFIGKINVEKKNSHNFLQN